MRTACDSITTSYDYEVPHFNHWLSDNNSKALNINTNGASYLVHAQGKGTLPTAKSNAQELLLHNGQGRTDNLVQ
jgi:hypothetical protein